MWLNKKLEQVGDFYDAHAYKLALKNLKEIKKFIKQSRRKRK